MAFRSNGARGRGVSYSRRRNTRVGQSVRPFQGSPSIILEETEESSDHSPPASILPDGVLNTSLRGTSNECGQQDGHFKDEALRDVSNVTPVLTLGRSVRRVTSEIEDEGQQQGIVNVS